MANAIPMHSAKTGMPPALAPPWLPATAMPAPTRTATVIAIAAVRSALRAPARPTAGSCSPIADLPSAGLPPGHPVSRRRRGG